MEEGLFSIGRIVKLHGVKGKIKVDYFGEEPSQISQYREVWVEDRTGRLTSYEILGVTPQPPRLILQLKGVQSADEAQALVGKTISVRRESLPDLSDGEYYWFEIIGMEVEADNGTHLGRVQEIIPTGSHDVYVIRGERGEILLPAVEGVIQGIDRERRIINVTWREGLWGKEDEV